MNTSRSRSRALLLFVGIAICISAAETWGDAAPDPVTLGRQYTSWFYAGETDRIWQIFSPEMRRLAASTQHLQQFRAQVLQRCGREIKVLDERAQILESGRFYDRRAICSVGNSPMLVQWALGNEGAVTGFSVDFGFSTGNPVRLFIGASGRKEISNHPSHDQRAQRLSSRLDLAPLRDPLARLHP